MSTDQEAGRLIIVCGLPGSGKTTRAKELERELRAIRFSPDEWMPHLGSELWDSVARGHIEEFQWKLAQNLLTLGHTVVIEWGTWGRSERDTLREGARALGAAVELDFLEAPMDVLLDRIRPAKLRVTADHVGRFGQVGRAVSAPFPRKKWHFLTPCAGRRDKSTGASRMPFGVPREKGFLKSETLRESCA